MIPESPSNLNAPLRPSNVKDASVFDQLNHLAEEIKTGIANLSNESADRILGDFERIKAASSVTKVPEMSHVTALFRKYADTAHDAIDELKGSMDKFGVMADLPSLYNFDEEHELAGWQAIKTNVFWIRVATAVFAMISFAVMSSVPNISYSQFNPSWEFNGGCPVFQGHYFNGQFDYWPYQFVLTIGVFLYVYSSIISVYYLLPVDENKRKMVPFLMRGSSSGLREQVETFLSILGKFTQAFWDGLLLLLSLFCVLMATIYMASTERFGINKYPFDFYFTLSSFYDTFTKTDPVCIDNNPCSRIRSSLAMFYFALLFQFLSFQIAYSAYRHELKSRKGLASREDVQAGLGQMRPVPVSSSQGYDDLATV